MSATAIEWTDVTWNPVTGCDRVSPGCDHCYALTLAKRLKGMGAEAYQRDGDPATSGPGFGLTMHPDRLDLPLHWRKPRMVFVNSMSDLFHKDVPDVFIAKVWATMALTPQHTYQVLTKRHARLRALLSSPDFWVVVGEAMSRRLGAPTQVDDVRALPNVWVGVSAEDQHWADIRIPALLNTPATIRFVSAEPLLGPIDLIGKPEHGCDYAGPAMTHTGHSWRVEYGSGVEYDCEHQPGLDWVIVGGESGPGHRPIDPEWVRSLRDQCVTTDVPFFFKQWGGARPKAGGKELDGQTWQQWPEVGA